MHAMHASENGTILAWLGRLRMSDTVETVRSSFTICTENSMTHYKIVMGTYVK